MTNAIDFGIKDFILIFGFGVGLPTWDQFSDYAMINRLFGYQNEWCTSYQNSKECIEEDELRVRRYGYAMIGPILLMTIFTIRQWWSCEKNWARIFTLPLVILQIFPQYKALRILYLALWKKSPTWKDEKEVYDRDIGTLGKCSNLIVFVLFITI